MQMPVEIFLDLPRVLCNVIRDYTQLEIADVLPYYLQTKKMKIILHPMCAADHEDETFVEILLQSIDRKCVIRQCHVEDRQEFLNCEEIRCFDRFTFVNLSLRYVCTCKRDQ